MWPLKAGALNRLQEAAQPLARPPFSEAPRGVLVDSQLGTVPPSKLSFFA